MNYSDRRVNDMTDTHDTARGGTDDVAEALHSIEQLEDRLHARGDPDAEEISALRRVIGRRLMDDALKSEQSEAASHHDDPRYKECNGCGAPVKPAAGYLGGPIKCLDCLEDLK